jgi:hypothetical protein
MLDLLRHFPNTTGYGRTALVPGADTIAGADGTADAGPACAVAARSPASARTGGAADFAAGDVRAGAGAAGGGEPGTIGTAHLGALAVGDAEG